MNIIVQESTTLIRSFLPNKMYVLYMIYGRLSTNTVLLKKFRSVLFKPLRFVPTLLHRMNLH